MTLLELGLQGDVVVDACTLNNAMNACQIALLIALLRWVNKPPAGPAATDQQADESRDSRFR